MRYLNRTILYALLSVLVVLTMSGCATMEIWDEASRSRVVIERVQIVTSNQVALAAKVIGTKRDSLFPFLSHVGVVDEFNLLRHQPDYEIRIVRCDRSSQIEQDAKESGVWEMSAEDWEEGDFLLQKLKGKSSLDFVILISDTGKWRKFLAVPVSINAVDSDSVQWSIMKLESPYIAYSNNSYIKRENGARSIVIRILFIPFALTVDLATLPVQVALGAFTCM